MCVCVRVLLCDFNRYVMNGGDSCGTNGKIVNHTFTLNIVCDKKENALPTDFKVTTVDECAYV